MYQAWNGNQTGQKTRITHIINANRVGMYYLILRCSEAFHGAQDVPYSVLIRAKMFEPMKRIWVDDDDDYHLVAYNGYGKPCHVITCPRELRFIARSSQFGCKVSACIWIVEKYK